MYLCRTLDPMCSEEDEYRCIEVAHLGWRYRSANTAVPWKRARLRAVS
jgi:hypothetical protein